MRIVYRRMRLTIYQECCLDKKKKNTTSTIIYINARTLTVHFLVYFHQLIENADIISTSAVMRE